MKRGKRNVGVAFGVLVAAVLISAAVQLWNVHRTTSDWALWPKMVPSKVQFANRDYQCGPNPAPGTRSLDGLTKQGKTAGGGDIYAARLEGPDLTATWIVVATQTATYTCDLIGGP